MAAAAQLAVAGCVPGGLLPVLLLVGLHAGHR
jgi:hypothetical protein